MRGVLRSDATLLTIVLLDGIASTLSEHRPTPLRPFLLGGHCPASCLADQNWEYALFEIAPVFLEVTPEPLLRLPLRLTRQIVKKIPSISPSMPFKERWH